MARDPNEMKARAGGKPASFRLQQQWDSEDLQEVISFLDGLCGALLVGDENVRRVKLLSQIALWSSRRGT